MASECGISPPCYQINHANYRSVQLSGHKVLPAEAQNLSSLTLDLFTERGEGGGWWREGHLAGGAESARQVQSLVGMVTNVAINIKQNVCFCIDEVSSGCVTVSVE